MRNYFKKLVSSLLIVCVILGNYGFPEEAKATTVEEVGPSLFQQIVNTFNSTSIATKAYTSELRETWLNTAATALAKTMIRELTADVVDWINNGFEGSPAFITNPGGFFMNVADQVTGEFIAQAGGDLADLCSNFSIDIRLALSFKYHKKPRKRYECTLGKMVSSISGKSIYSAEHEAYMRATDPNWRSYNTGSSVLDRTTLNGQNIQKFMDGDFNQGGWPAFAKLSVDTQNNPYGAYLEANSELGIRVANARFEKDKELNRGGGFLSWRNPECKKKVEANNKAVDAQFAALEDASGSEFSQISNNTGGESLKRQSLSDCPIETPGSVIAGGMINSANGPLRELELVDSINEIVNALAAQLINTILTGGLKSLSGSGPSDSTSYVQNIQVEAQSVNTPQIREMRDKFIGEVDKARADTLRHKDSKDASLDLMIGAQNEYNRAIKCYEDTKNPNFQNYINSINQEISTNIRPVITKLYAEAVVIDQTYSDLEEVKRQVLTAQSVTNMNRHITSFSILQSTGKLTTPEQIILSERELTEIASLSANLTNDAERKYQECIIVTSGGSGVRQN